MVGLKSGQSTVGSTIEAGPPERTTYVNAPNERNRWGDYCGLAVDPSRPVFWAFNEYAQSTPNQNEWATRLGKFGFPTTISVFLGMRVVCKPQSTGLFPARRLKLMAKFLQASNQFYAEALTITNTRNSCGETWRVDPNNRWKWCKFKY